MCRRSAPTSAASPTWRSLECLSGWHTLGFIAACARLAHEPLGSTGFSHRRRSAPTFRMMVVRGVTLLHMRYLL